MHNIFFFNYVDAFTLQGLSPCILLHGISKVSHSLFYSDCFANYMTLAQLGCKATTQPFQVPMASFY